MAKLKELTDNAILKYNKVSSYFYSEHLFYIVWEHILTPHDGQRKFDLSGIQTCDHPHAGPELYHCATDNNSVFSYNSNY